MTIEEFVADLRANAPKHISPDWLDYQQGRAIALGLDWQEITTLIAQQQAAAVQKVLETP